MLVSSGAKYEFSHSSENKSYLNDSANRGDAHNNITTTRHCFTNHFSASVNN